MMRTLRSRFLVPTILCGLLVAITACGDDDDNPQAPNPDPDEIATDHTDPIQLIEAHEKALNTRNLSAYEALLDGDFEFFPAIYVVLSSPWMTGDSWSRDEELGMINNMFDSNFSGHLKPLQSIEAEMVVLSQKSLSNGHREVTCTFQALALTGPSEGFAFNTRMIFDLVQRDGFLRIARITEFQLGRGRGDNVSSVDTNSWGLLKTLYRGEG